MFEATGPYHRDLEQRLQQAGPPFARVNPRQARRFAEAIGTLAKTDRVDALLLARFGALLEPSTRPARPDHLRQIEAQLVSLDAATDALIAADPALARRREILLSIPGLGAVTVNALRADMPERGTMEPSQAASLAGLAPIIRASGPWQGKSFIQGGRAHLRQALYMPALVAMRFNKDLARHDNDLIERGNHPKVGITAMMRRLVVLANALLRDGRTWQPEPPTPAAAKG